MPKKDPKTQQMDEQMRITTRMMKKILDDIDLEGIDLQGETGTNARRFNCYGTFGTFGTYTGCFGTAGTLGCRTRAQLPTDGPKSRTSSGKSVR